MYPQNNDNWILSYATKDLRFWKDVDSSLCRSFYAWSFVSCYFVSMLSFDKRVTWSRYFNWRKWIVISYVGKTKVLKSCKTWRLNETLQLNFGFVSRFYSLVISGPAFKTKQNNNNERGYYWMCRSLDAVCRDSYSKRCQLWTADAFCTFVVLCTNCVIITEYRVFQLLD